MVANSVASRKDLRNNLLNNLRKHLRKDLHKYVAKAFAKTFAKNAASARARTLRYPHVFNERSNVKRHDEFDIALYINTHKYSNIYILYYIYVYGIYYL